MGERKDSPRTIIYSSILENTRIDFRMTERENKVYQKIKVITP